MSRSAFLQDGRPETKKPCPFPDFSTYVIPGSAPTPYLVVTSATPLSSAGATVSPRINECRNMVCTPPA